MACKQPGYGIVLSRNDVPEGSITGETQKEVAAAQRRLLKNVGNLELNMS